MTGFTGPVKGLCCRELARCKICRIAVLWRRCDLLSFTSMSAPVLVWFRLDLRLEDNPALAAAASRGWRVVPIFIWAPGAASRWWFNQSLQSLDSGLRRRGTRLILRRGPSLDALRSLVRETGADAVFWNRRCEPAVAEGDERVRSALLADGLDVETCISAHLHEPSEIMNSSGKPFRMFTPFWRTCLEDVPGRMVALLAASQLLFRMASLVVLCVVCCRSTLRVGRFVGASGNARSPFPCDRHAADRSAGARPAAGRTIGLTSKRPECSFPGFRKSRA
jgi:hypothetical protein